MYFPLLRNDPSKVGPLAWACWGMGLAITLLGVVPVFVPNPVWKDIGGLVFSVIRSYLMAFPLLIMFIVAFAMTGNKDATAQVAFARNFFLPLAPMFNYLVWMNVDPGPETPILGWDCCGLGRAGRRGGMRAQLRPSVCTIETGGMGEPSISGAAVAWIARRYGTRPSRTWESYAARGNGRRVKRSAVAWSRRASRSRRRFAPSASNEHPSETSASAAERSFADVAATAPVLSVMAVEIGPFSCPMRPASP